MELNELNLRFLAPIMFFNLLYFFEKINFFELNFREMIFEKNKYFFLKSTVIPFRRKKNIIGTKILKIICRADNGVISRQQTIRDKFMITKLFPQTIG